MKTDRTNAETRRAPRNAEGILVAGEHRLVNGIKTIEKYLKANQAVLV